MFVVMRAVDSLDRWIAQLNPCARIEELRVQVRILREQRDREIEGRLFAEELLARGIRAPRGDEFDRDGRLMD